MKEELGKEEQEETYEFDSKIEQWMDEKDNESQHELKTW